MEQQEATRILGRVQELQKEIARLGPLMRGSVVIIGTTTKRACFSLHKDGKTRLIYLGKSREGLAREYSANYQRLREIVEEMTELNMLLLKEGRAPSSRKAKDRKEGSS